MHAEPQQEHYWLQRLVGEWLYEHDAFMEPGKPPEKFQGTETVRSLGDLWVLCQSKGEMCGGAATTLMTLGYDPARKKFVGSFLGTMMAHLWIYEGDLAADGGSLVLVANGPSFAVENQKTDYKDVIAFEGNDLRTLNSSILGPDGVWNKFMTATYRRSRLSEPCRAQPDS